MAEGAKNVKHRSKTGKKSPWRTERLGTPSQKGFANTHGKRSAQLKRNGKRELDAREKNEREKRGTMRRQKTVTDQRPGAEKKGQ